MQIELVKSREQWDSMVASNFAHPLQLWGWGDLKAAHGSWKVHHLSITHDGEQVAFAQVLERKLPLMFKSMLFIARGPHILDETYTDEIFSELTKWGKNKGATLLKVEPAWGSEHEIPNGWRKSRTTIFIPKTLILDLGRTEDELLAAMSKKTRQYVRKSTKECTVRLVKYDDLDFEDVFNQVIDIYKQTGVRANFGIHSADYYRDVAKLMESGAKLYIASEPDNPDTVLALLWNIETLGIVFELYGGVNDLGQRLRVNYALKWRAITDAKFAGIKDYDMNGLVSDGVSGFKLGFVGNDSSKSTEFIGTLDKPLKPALYFIWERLLPLVRKTMRALKR